MTENTITAAETFLKTLTRNGDLPWMIKGEKAAELLVEWGEKIAQGESNMLDEAEGLRQ